MLLALGDGGQPRGIRQLLATTDEASAALSRAIAYEQDAVITHAITAALNDSEWKLDRIAPRVHRNYDSVTHVEMWVLDGEPLVEIWPFELKPLHHDNQWKISASFRYYVYPRTGGAC